MKTLVISGAILLLAAEVSLACTRVVAPAMPEPSSRNARISVSLDGKPAGNVYLMAHFPGKRGQLSLHTASDGTARLKDLPEGITCVTAAGPNHLTAGFCLEVAAGSTDKVSSFQMVLTATPSWLLSPQDKVDEVEQAPLSNRMRSLKGTVLDPTGAVIPKAEIQVYKRGSYPQNQVKILKTTEDGRFAASLEPGIYTVIFRMPGFRSEFLSVEITPDALGGSEIELLQTLQVGSGCDW